MTDASAPQKPLHVQLPEGYKDWPEEQKREFVRSVLAAGPTPPSTGE